MRQTGSSSSIDLIPYEQAYEVGFEDMERRRPDITKVEAAVDWYPTLDLSDIIQDVADFLELTRD